MAARKKKDPMNQENYPKDDLASDIMEDMEKFYSDCVIVVPFGPDGTPLSEEELKRARENMPTRK